MIHIEYYFKLHRVNKIVSNIKAQNYELTSSSINLADAAGICTSRPCENCSPFSRLPSTATYKVYAREPPAIATLYELNGRNICGPTTDILKF